MLARRLVLSPQVRPDAGEQKSIGDSAIKKCEGRRGDYGGRQVGKWVGPRAEREPGSRAADNLLHRGGERPAPLSRPIDRHPQEKEGESELPYETPSTESPRAPLPPAAPPPAALFPSGSSGGCAGARHRGWEVPF